MTPEEITVQNSIAVMDDIMEGGAFIYASVKMTEEGYRTLVLYNDRLIVDYLQNVIEDWVTVDDWKE